MHLAAAEGHREVIEYLMEIGVNPKADRWGGYPIADAQNGNHLDIVRLFEQGEFPKRSPEHLVEDAEGPSNSGAKFGNDIVVVELLWAAAENDLPGLRRLLAQGIPVHAMDYDRRTALHLAAAEGQLEAVKYLVSHGHPLLVRDRWHAIPLDEAKREQRSSVIEYLNVVVLPKSLNDDVEGPFLVDHWDEGRIALSVRVQLDVQVGRCVDGRC